MTNSFDVIVIGGGHAGIEACIATAKMGCSTALISMSVDTIGRLSCNPSIGGSAKGHLVKEIDAIGGVMPLIADRSGLQFKMLNTSKGPAIWSPRSQNDKYLYPYYAQQILKETKNLTLIEGMVSQILCENNNIKGIVLQDETIYCKALILCGGTFLNGKLYTGKEVTDGGRVQEKSAIGLSDSLLEFGLEIGRLKTGTPPRIYSSSVDFSKTKIECGDDPPIPFSHKSQRVKNSIVCYSTHTNENTHEILQQGFIDSPMFTGLITGRGPRYCPSIEDKIYRFQDRTSHQIVLEPEALQSNTIYVNGFSTSLPKDIQERALKTIPGLEHAIIEKYGYAVEYDFFYPYQLHYTLESRKINGLYMAGQINGTSGYEEAASQGLIAGINAASKIKGLPELILSRADAYIGVMIDDLVNKSSDEPYRIFTSLAEYRLLLRQDNAFERLYDKTSIYGLHNGTQVHVLHRLTSKYKMLSEIRNIKIDKETANIIYTSVGESITKESEPLMSMCKRPAITLSLIRENSSALDQWKGTTFDSILKQAEIEIKYEGYIARHLVEISKFKELENKLIPDNYDFSRVHSLSKESKEKLMKIKPISIGQASRIPGVSPTDISLLVIALKR
ncbi:MAG: tRNA uridine-5-carboxymethylaminomethyl(34) synthesis enzyme MnmG [Bacteroidota bacterium]